MPRMSIYVSDRRDNDIVSALAHVPDGDKSWYLKELIRDGIRYRMGIEPSRDAYSRSTQVYMPGTQPSDDNTEEHKKEVKKKKQSTKKSKKKTEPEIVEQDENVKPEDVKSEAKVEEKPKEVTPEKVIDKDDGLGDDPMSIFDKIDINQLQKSDDELDAELDEKLDAL